MIKMEQTVLSKNAGLCELALIGFLDAGMNGLRQEMVYPPEGFRLSSGDRYASGNLRNQVSELGAMGIRLVGIVDPYLSMDGRITPYKRYRLQNLEQATLAVAMVGALRKRRGAQPLSEDEIQSMLSQFISEVN